MKNLRELQAKMGYSFKDISLLKNALTHTSYINEHRDQKLVHNERLEFMGDAVLEMVSSEFLYGQYPDMPEGSLTKLRASLVCEPSLAITARALDLGPCLIMGRGEDKNGGRLRDSILSDAVEAIIAAIYFDGGITEAKAFIHNHVLNDIQNKRLFVDSKTILQEKVQASGGTVRYELIDTQGPPHDRTFVVEVLINDKTAATGQGRSKKAAEQQAAYEVLQGEQE
ncbi:MAG: ribonuclease III [Lachnospiraceae bacterium]|nr:ribonuclease III [Candidatus Equihabitans merdae]